MKFVFHISRVAIVFCSLLTFILLSFDGEQAHGQEFKQQPNSSPEKVQYPVTSEVAPLEMLRQVTAAGAASDIPTGPRYRAAGTSCDGKEYYVMGGSDVVSTLLNEAWRYRPADDTWTRLADMPVPLMNFEAACSDGIIYLVGGYNGSSHTNNFQMYDIAHDSWTLTTWPHVRTPMTAVFNGLLYTMGGNPGPSNETWVYDPDASSWTQLADMPTANSYGAAITVDNYIYQIGGALAKTVQRFDPNSNTWDNSGPQLQDARMSALTAWYGQYIFVVSGGGSGGSFWTGWPTIEVYDYSQWPSGSWLYASDSVPTPFVGAAGDCTADAIWGAGGTSNGATLATNQYVTDNMRCHFPFPWPMFLPAITNSDATPPPPIPDTVTGFWEVYLTSDAAATGGSPSYYLNLNESNGSITGNELCDPGQQTVTGNVDGQEVVIYIHYFRYGVALRGTLNGIQINGTYTAGSSLDPITGTFRATKVSDVTCP